MELIKNIADSLESSERVEISRIKDALEDGAALASMGISDDDQGTVEEAHDICSTWMKEGREFL
ncbi:hypothetical protein AABD69_09055 [Edwardsiella piscicida]|uniref:hypothetical protein n=1 Tax=Edwardsiella piscicida TaxID=1263550 RepID=UPI000D50B3EC